MKKLLTLLTVFTLITFAANAQAFKPYILKYDTTGTKPFGSKINLNKADSQIVVWDKYSWKNLVVSLADTALIDFAQATATTVTDVTKTIPGARLGDEVVIGVPNASLTATATFWGWVSAANTVTIRYSPKATENPASGVFHITVIKYHEFR